MDIKSYVKNYYLDNLLKKSEPTFSNKLKFKFVRFLNDLCKPNYVVSPINLYMLKKHMFENDIEENFLSINNKLNWVSEDKLSADYKFNILSLDFYKCNKYFPNIKNPQTFNEKILWLILYYDDKRQAEFADKALAKKKIAELVSDKYVIPTYAIYDSASDIDYSSLPKTFILKSNWGSFANHIFRIEDKSLYGEDVIKAIVAQWVQPYNNYYFKNFSTATLPEYTKGKIIAEKFLYNYEEFKIFCFNSHAKFVRKVKRQQYYNINWDFLFSTNEENTPCKKPKMLNTMIEIAEKLSANFPFMRVDFYVSDENIYVGECTFYTNDAHLHFPSKEKDYMFGKELVLPTIK